MQKLIPILLALIVTHGAVLAADEPIALIEFNEIEIQKVIEVLAAEIEPSFNFILDPHVKKPFVTARWENLTARQALDKFLKEQQLTMVTNPVTSVARIAPTNLNVKPVPSRYVGSDTNGVIPTLEMDSVYLREAVTNIASRAGLSVSLDPKWSQEALGYRRVSFEWKNITASQALAALLDNYDLVLEKETTNSPARVVVK